MEHGCNCAVGFQGGCLPGDSSCRVNGFASLVHGRKTMSDQGGGSSGLTSDQAKEFHSAYMQGYLGFVAIAVVAHVLIWMWKPWFV